MGLVREGKLEPVDPSRITEDVHHAWYRSPSHVPPAAGATEPEPGRKGGYSWLKAPRYDGQAFEVGPTARAMVAYASRANVAHVEALDEILARLKLRPDHLASVIGRHVSRAVETKVMADAMADWVLQIKLDQPVCAPHKIPDSATGMGLWDASRGALGHWIAIENRKIGRYQAVVPTTWNASPRDDRGQPGPIEVAMTGAMVPDVDNPFALARIVRSFDPCIACAVHLVSPIGESLREVKLG
jgi:hydrogenase large subunit